jgi:hypothetical protein
MIEKSNSDIALFLCGLFDLKHEIFFISQIQYLNDNLRILF